ncbi:MAG TPA: YihY/virulence factor BrkB family protein [Acidimicrobiales bacterium]|nr:YihY/virulence factor BrkB family protein [Acidimicrobiales bacterium]
MPDVPQSSTENDETGSTPPRGDHGPAAASKRAVARARERTDKVVAWAVEQEEQAERRVPSLAMGRELAKRYRVQNAPVLAGHIAFRLFIFMLPVILILASVLGALKGAGVDVKASVGGSLGFSNSFSTTLGHNAQEAHRGWVALAATGLFTLVLAGLALFSAFHYCFTQAWGMEPTKMERKYSRLPKFVLGFILVIAILFAAFSVGHYGVLPGVAAFAVMVVVIVASFVGLGTMLPHRSAGWYWMIPGALAAAVGIILLQVFAVLYLPHKVATASALYGSIGAAVALLFYLFLVANIIVGSALVNAVWWDFFNDPSKSSDEYWWIRLGLRLRPSSRSGSDTAVPADKNADSPVKQEPSSEVGGMDEAPGSSR